MIVKKDDDDASFYEYADNTSLHTNSLVPELPLSCIERAHLAQAVIYSKLCEIHMQNNQDNHLCLVLTRYIYIINK